MIDRQATSWPARIASDTFLLDETVLAGWFGGRGFIAAELGWDHMLLTSLRPMGRYRAIHPAAPDAWFANTGGHLRAGAQGGWSVGPFELGLRFGMVRTETTALPLMPFLVDLGAGVRF